MLLIGAGQTALAGNVPMLQRLSGRFTIPVELSDADVETVTRRVVLAKKADKRKSIEDILNAHAGEIDRHSRAHASPPREDRQTSSTITPCRFADGFGSTYPARWTAPPVSFAQLKIVHEAVRQPPTPARHSACGFHLRPPPRAQRHLLREIDRPSGSSTTTPLKADWAAAPDLSGPQASANCG
jgi:hypothetical protein